MDENGVHLLQRVAGLLPLRDHRPRRRCVMSDRQRYECKTRLCILNYKRLCLSVCHIGLDWISDLNAPSQRSYTELNI